MLIEPRERSFSLPEERHPSVSLQVLIQGLQNLNRAVHQDVVALQLFPQSQWVAPSSVLLQDVGEAKEDDVDEEEQKAVNLSFVLTALPAVAADRVRAPGTCVLLPSPRTKW